MVYMSIVNLLEHLKEGNFNVKDYKILSEQEKVLLAEEFFKEVETNIDLGELLDIIRAEYHYLDNHIEGTIEEMVDELKLFNLSKSNKEKIEWFCNILNKIDDFSRYLKIEFMFGLIDCLNELRLPTPDEEFVAYYFKSFELIVNLNDILIKLSSLTGECNEYNIEMLIKLLNEERKESK